MLKDKSKADELRLLVTKSDDDVVFDIFKEEDNYQDKCLQTDTEINKVFELFRSKLSELTRRCNRHLSITHITECSDMSRLLEIKIQGIFDRRQK
jgi:hypothetical protein